jgi:hypothetical protein
MDIDLEECFRDSYKKEALVAEVIVQNLMSGAYIDISDAENHLEYEHWKDIVRKFAVKHGIK